MKAKMLLLLVLAPMLPVAGQDSGPKPSESGMRQVLTPLMPRGLVVREISLDGMQATISGSTPVHGDISEFLRNVGGSPVLEQAELKQIQSAGEISEFVMTMVVQCPTAYNAAVNPCQGGSSYSAPATVHKCTIDGVVTFQSTPCPED